MYEHAVLVSYVNQLLLHFRRSNNWGSLVQCFKTNLVLHFAPTDFIITAKPIVGGSEVPIDKPIDFILWE